jgi:hypothetical protein
LLTVYRTYPPFAHTEIACNDDFGGTKQSQVTFNLPQGEIFLIEVSSVGSSGGGLLLLTVDYPCTPPSITSQPQSQTITSGQNAQLSVSATGTSLSYQWYRGSSGDTSQPIPGANLNTYSTGALTSTTSYWVRVSNTCDSVDSPTATITVSTSLTDLTIGGYLGVGTETPQRAVHLVGPNAVFRMDRSTDTAAFLLVRTDDLGNPLKAFVVGANASGLNQGEFIINDIGAAVGGGGQRRMTITNTGETVFTGSLTGNSFLPASSLALKTNIRLLEDPIGKVKDLTGVSFTWKSNGLPSLGLIGEKVADVLPELISRETRTGVLQGVNYDGLIALLLESSKAQRGHIEALRAKRERLQRLLDELAKSNQRLEERVKP